MKLIYIILILIILLKSVSLLSNENCNIITNCENKKYQYYFCSQTSLELKCSSNPNTDPGPPYRVMKAPYPICLTFLDSGPEDVIMKEASGDIDKPVYRKDWMQVDADCAKDEINCICNKKNEPCLCRIYFKFNSNKDDFAPKPSSTPGRAALIVNGSNCVASCNDLYPRATEIWLNNSKDFTGVDPKDKKKKKFFYNNRYYEEDNEFLISLRQDYKVFNLCLILKHELAHVLGMGHHGMCDPDISYGVMNTGDYPNKANTPFSNDDLCMFKKVYCPSLVPVEDEKIITNEEPQNFPNPFFTQTRIKYYVGIDSKVSIEIYNHLGEKILNISKFCTSGENTEKIDMSYYSSGIYYYIIKTKDRTDIQKMVLIK